MGINLKQEVQWQRSPIIAGAHFAAIPGDEKEDDNLSEEHHIAGKHGTTERGVLHENVN